MNILINEEQLILLEKKSKYTASSTFNNYPQSGTNQAQKAIEWKEKYGDEVKGGTKVGWTRARQLAERKPISYDTVKRIARFERHKKNSKVDPKHKNEPWKDRGNVAYMIWGGQSMIDWAKGIVKQVEKTKNER